MSVSIDDLKPKPFTLEVKGREFTAQPPKLWHMLVLSKVAEILQAPHERTAKQLQETEEELRSVLNEVLPETRDIQLDFQTTIDIITELMNSIEPDDNQELKAAGVKTDVDPKAGTTG